jgi:UDP-glucose 4-epimerase
MVVTGGAGFIGSRLCEALLDRGDRVTCVDSVVGTDGTTRNVDHILDDPSFVLVNEDVLTWAEDVILRDVDCIFHLAASKKSASNDDPERDLAVNALGTLRLLHAAVRDGPRKLVHASTGSVIGEADRRHTADLPSLPVSYYGASKLAAESYCRVVGIRSGLYYTILRYYHVIGPRQDNSDRGGVVPIFARHALRGEPLTIEGDGNQTRSFTSVHDAVRANLIALEHPDARTATLTCASGVRVSIRQLADYVFAETGSAGGMHRAPERGDIRHFHVDNTALRRLGLDFATDWQAMVRGVIAALVPAEVA